MPKLQFGDDSYRIVADDGTEGELALYGDPAELVTAGHRYVAVCDEADGEEIVSLLPGKAWIVDGRDVAGVTIEDVDFREPEPEAGKPEGTVVVEEEEEDEEDDDDDFVSEPGEEEEEEDEEDDDFEDSHTRTAAAVA